MSDRTPTRSAVLELRDERRAMSDGHGFLEEKCLLLAGEMMREMARQEKLARQQMSAWESAVGSLAAAVARHGLEALQVHPAATADGSQVKLARRSLIGVPLLDAQLVLAQTPARAGFDRSPESEACRASFAALAAIAAEAAASSGNLERLHAEYRRAVRRTRALEDILLPEIDDTLAEFEARLADLEQEDAISMRHGTMR